MKRPPLLNPSTDALFLDFDGTLADIVADPDAARLSEDRSQSLIALATRFGGAACVLSGRALADLDRRAPDALWRVGGHGAETAPPGPASAQAVSDPDLTRRRDALLKALAPLAEALPGVHVETKTHGAALHYRRRPDAEAACHEAMTRALDAIAGFEMQAGKRVIEARPEGVEKGRALTGLMARAPFSGRRPVMVGDDLTDESAMRAAMALGGAGVKVGPGPSVADWRLDSPDDVFEWLEQE